LFGIVACALPVNGLLDLVARPRTFGTLGIISSSRSATRRSSWHATIAEGELVFSQSQGAAKTKDGRPYNHLYGHLSVPLCRALPHYKECYDGRGHATSTTS